MISYVDLKNIHVLQTNQQQQQQSKLVNKKRNERLLTDEIKLPLFNRCCVEHISSNVR